MMKKALLRLSISTLVVIIALFWVHKNQGSPFLGLAILLFQSINVCRILLLYFSEQDQNSYSEDGEEIDLEDLIELHDEISTILSDAEDDGEISFCDECGVYHLLEESEMSDKERWIQENKVNREVVINEIFEDMIANDGGVIPRPPSKAWRRVAICTGALCAVSIFIIYGFTAGIAATLTGTILFYTIFSYIDFQRTRWENVLNELASEKSFLALEPTNPEAVKLSEKEEATWQEILHSLNDF